MSEDKKIPGTNFTIGQEFTFDKDGNLIEFESKEEITIERLHQQTYPVIMETANGVIIVKTMTVEEIEKLHTGKLNE